MEEEISLRELIDVLIKEKTIIAVLTILAVFTSGVLSFFVISPTYEARATLMVDLPNVQKQQTDSAVAALLDSLSQYPAMTMETYRSQVTNPHLLQQVIDDLELTDMTITGLANKVQVTNVKDTNLVNITVKDNDPAEAAAIANTIAQEFISFINEQNRDKMSRSATFLHSQMEVEEQKLNEAVEEYKDFLAQSPGVEELKQDISTHLSMLNNFKTQLVQTELALEQVKTSLATAEQELAKTPKVFTVKKSVLDDPLAAGLLEDQLDKDTAALAQLNLESEELNPNYISLSNVIATGNIESARLEREVAGLKREIVNTSNMLEQLQIEYADKKTIHDKLEQRVNTARSSHEAFFNKYEETRIAEASEMGETTVNIAAVAPVPDRPVAPKKMLNLAIAGVLGVMVGVFVAFFREYWRSTSQQVNKKKNTVGA